MGSSSCRLHSSSCPLPRPFRGSYPATMIQCIPLITKKLVVANIGVLYKGIKSPNCLSRILMRHLMGLRKPPPTHPPCENASHSHLGCQLQRYRFSVRE